MIAEISAAQSGQGSALLRIDRNAPSPCAAASDTLGAASTTAPSKIQPATPDTRTDRTMPQGTLLVAPMVSSAACADASKPVIV